MPRREHFAHEEAWQQATDERWRAVGLAVKAKLELCALGASSIEREFMASMVAADGRVLARHLDERMRAAFVEGRRPVLQLTA